MTADPADQNLDSRDVCNGPLMPLSTARARRGYGIRARLVGGVRCRRRQGACATHAVFRPYRRPASSGNNMIQAQSLRRAPFRPCGLWGPCRKPWSRGPRTCPSSARIVRRTSRSVTNHPTILLDSHPSSLNDQRRLEKRHRGQPLLASRRLGRARGQGVHQGVRCSPRNARRRAGTACARCSSIKRMTSAGSLATTALKIASCSRAINAMFLGSEK